MTWLIVYIPFWEHTDWERLKTLIAQCVADKYVLIFDGGDPPSIRFPGVEYRHNPEPEGLIRSLRKWVPKKALYYCVIRQRVRLSASTWTDIAQEKNSLAALYCGKGEDGFLMMNWVVHNGERSE